MFDSFFGRKDVSAVKAILEKRYNTDLLSRRDVVMSSVEGRTLVGAIVWNIGTLWQDSPAFVIVGAMALIFLLSNLVYTLVSGII